MPGKRLVGAVFGNDHPVVVAVFGNDHPVLLQIHHFSESRLDKEIDHFLAVSGHFEMIRFQICLLLGFSLFP
jgi:hypothetical protein